MDYCFCVVKDMKFLETLSKSFLVRNIARSPAKHKYLLNFKHVSSSIEMNATPLSCSKLSMCLNHLLTQGYSANNCTRNSASRMYDIILHIFNEKLTNGLRPQAFACLFKTQVGT